MSLSTYSGAASYDITANTGKLDLSEELAEIIRPDNTVFINKIGGAGSFSATQTTHRWNEDSLNPNTALPKADGDGTLTNSGVDTSLTVYSGHGPRFKIGTLFKYNTQGESEVIQVTAVTGDVLTIVRGYGSTSAENHANTDAIMIIAHTKPEGWAPGTEDWTRERSALYNYTQIFGRGIYISYTRQAIDHAGIASELAHQTAYRLKEIMREMDHTLINSIRSADAGSDTSYRSMGGLIEFVSAAGGNTNATSEALIESKINASAKQIWDDGGNPDFLLVGGSKKQTIATFDQAYRRMDFNSKSAGFTVERFLTDLGFELEIIVDPWMPDDTYIVGEKSRIKVGPLTGDTIRLEALAKTGRAHNAMITGQYTCEVRNALEAFAIHTNLT
jgi:hypothetical protein